MLMGACVVIAGAQEDSPLPGRSYHVGERRQTALQDTHSADTGQPLRLARFDYVSGNVTWRSDASAPWSKASVNRSLRQGAQAWVTNGGRAEIRFDDGSLLRLGDGAVVTLQTLYSDSQGNFTGIKMASGLATLRLRREHAIYQMNTPFVTIDSDGPSRVRVGVGDTVEVGVRLGSAVVEGARGKTTLHAGDYLDLRDANADYAIRSLPREDSWERWNDERDREIDASAHPVHKSSYAPPPFVWFSLNLPFIFSSHSSNGYGHWGGYWGGHWDRGWHR
jgi:hypothetical protein